MRITIISCTYPPEPVVTSQTSGQIAEKLSSEGNKVCVISPFPNRPMGKIYSGYKRKILKSFKINDNLELIRCFSTFSPRSSLFSRFLENITFGIISSLVLLVSKKPDVLYSNSWPLFATGMVVFVSKLRKIPVIINIQDLYPESISFQGRISGQSPIILFLKYLDGIIARSCSSIIVISEKFFDIYSESRKVDPRKIYVIPNWIKDKLFLYDKNDNDIRRLFNLNDEDFLLVYGGNVGSAAGVETIIEAFNFLQNKSIYLLIAGQGSNWENCKNLALEKYPKNIFFYYPWNSDYRVLLASDLLVLPTIGKQSFASVPSKLLAYMLSSKPILALVLEGSDTESVFRKANCGWIIPPDNPHLLAQKIEEIIKIPKSQLNEIGYSGRSYAKKTFVDDICLPKIIEVILGAKDEIKYE